MRGTWNTGLKPFGVPLKINWTIVVWPLFVWGLGWVLGAQVLSILAFSLLFHEYAHVGTAKAMGIETTDVTVFALGGAARIPSLMSMSPGREAVVAAAGPLSSFLLAGIAFLVSVLFGEPTYLSMMVSINLALAIFNALPVLPMDGGRIFRAALTPKAGRLRATKIATAVAVAVGAAIGLLGLAYGNWNIVILMPLVVLMAFAELNMAKQYQKLRDICDRYEERLGVPVTLDFVDGKWQISYPGGSEVI